MLKRSHYVIIENEQHMPYLLMDPLVLRENIRDSKQLYEIPYHKMQKLLKQKVNQVSLLR